MTRVRCARVLAPALALVVLVLALPSAASAQATRTWVSGVGDDANPCSRTAPCKTFAGSISKTAAGGEINCLDPGGFGGVTITKSLTIKCHYTEGGVLVSGTNAIVVNAANTDKVVLRGLDINGIGIGAQTSLTGVKVLSAARVTIVDSEIYRFQDAVAVVPTNTGGSRLYMARNHIHDNGVGVFLGPGNATTAFAVGVLRYNDIHDNTCGVVASSSGANASTPVAATNCGTAAAPGLNRAVVASLFHNGINQNDFGVFTRGANAVAELAWNEVIGNASFGLRRLDGSFIRTFTPASNAINNNGASDLPNGSIGMTRIRKAVAAARR
jgi:hypothetical protein